MVRRRILLCGHRARPKVELVAHERLALIHAAAGLLSSSRRVARYVFGCGGYATAAAPFRGAFGRDWVSARRRASLVAAFFMACARVAVL